MTPVPILLYHSVAPTATAEYRRWCIDPRRFDEHLAVVDELGYTPLTVSDFVDRRRTGALPERPLLITFDDGRGDFAEHALELLHRRNVPATLYVVAGYVGKTSAFLPMEDERSAPMLSWDELAACSAAGVEIGAHSMTHRELDVMAVADLDREVARSRDVLEANLGIGIHSFAYPHGYHRAPVVDAVRRAGFSSACAVKDRWSHDGDDRFALARLFVWDTTTAADLEDLLSHPPSSPTDDRWHRPALRWGWRNVRRVRRLARGVRVGAS